MTTPTKQELLAALRTSREEVLTIVRGMSAAAMEEGHYENGWNARQILAHLASIEWTYPKLIEVARAADATPREGADVPARAMRGGNDSYNDRQVAKRADKSAAELLAEFEENRAATLRAVEAVDEELLARHIRSAGGLVGPLALVFRLVAVDHVRGHLRDIVGTSA
jgi:hypothetical protein